jgi:hypothetical protein
VCSVGTASWLKLSGSYSQHCTGRGWKSTFLCDSKEDAEAALRKLGSTWEWLPDGHTLKTITATVPAVRVDNTGTNRSLAKTFYNSIVAAYTGWNDSRNVGERAVVLARDGPEESYLDPAAIRDAVSIMQEICVAIPWKAGDVMLVDNRTAMHSRRPFEGPRRVLAGLVRDPER